jgi:hypothetical protein
MLQKATSQMARRPWEGVEDAIAGAGLEYRWRP